MAASGVAAASAAAEVKTLVDLSNDSLEKISRALIDPLTPHDAVTLASTCRGLRALTEAALEELRQRHEAAKALCRKFDTSCAAVSKAAVLDWESSGLTVANCTALVDIVATNGLPRLEALLLAGHGFSAEGVQALAESLGSDTLPSLRLLNLDGNGLGDLRVNGIGDVGASALGAALGRGALPRLEKLNLSVNRIGSAELTVLAPGLRALPQLKTLYLDSNGIGDDGVAALVAPGEGVLPSLEELSLKDNEVTDAGCSALTAALSSGAMPSLKRINLVYNPASHWAAVNDALARRNRATDG